MRIGHCIGTRVLCRLLQPFNLDPRMTFIITRPIGDQPNRFQLQLCAFRWTKFESGNFIAVCFHQSVKFFYLLRLRDVVGAY